MVCFNLHTDTELSKQKFDNNKESGTLGVWTLEDSTYGNVNTSPLSTTQVVIFPPSKLSLTLFSSICTPTPFLVPPPLCPFHHQRFLGYHLLSRRLRQSLLELGTTS